MGFIAILAALLLAPLSPTLNGRDAARRGSGSETNQEATANPQVSNPDPAPADPQQTESSPGQTPPAKEAEKHNPQKPPSSRPVAGAHKRRSRGHKPAATTPDGQTHKVVIRHGGATDPIAQIVPGITQEEASHQRENAEQLLVSAESNLKQLAGRTLNLNRQGVVVQIRQYVDGARLALKESDTQRAHTLALKAFWLSDDLVKR
jgi:hypothetical protein